ncbi:MAG: hypothetical protein AAGJ11_09990 [Bacteroidota bacterium]
MATLVVLAALAYTAFPSTHGSARMHRHADGRVHTHQTAERTHASAAERDASVRHGGVHAHNGQVHVHDEAAHPHRTAPEAEASTVSKNAVPALAGATAPPPVRAVTHAPEPPWHWANEIPSVETPPPIVRG